MNIVRIGVITIFAAAGASGYLSLRKAASIDEQTPRPARAQVTRFAANVQSPFSNSERPAVQPPSISEAPDLASGPDTTGLLAPTTTIGELLDAFDADIGEDGEPIDREAVGAALRADPALTTMLRHAHDD